MPDRPTIAMNGANWRNSFTTFDNYVTIPVEKNPGYHRPSKGGVKMNPIRIFGVNGLTGMGNPHLEIVFTPVGEICSWCGEEIGYDDIGFVMDEITEDEARDSFWHQECLIRNIIGSVAHQRKECSCYGGTEEDPPSMTKREAARAALKESQS